MDLENMDDELRRTLDELGRLSSMHSKVAEELLSELKKKKTSGSGKNESASTSKFSKRVEEAATAAGNLANSLGTGSQGFGDVFATAGTVVAGFAKFVGPVGFALTGLGVSIAALTDYVFGSVHALNDLRDVGLGFGQGMGNLRAAVSLSGLAFDDLVSVMHQFSGVVTKMGTDGGMRFAEMTAQLRTSLIPFGNFGLTAKETAMYLGEYLEMQRESNLLGRLTSAEQTIRAANYISSLDEMTMILGKSKQELLANSKTLNLNTRMQAAMANLSQENQAIFADNSRKLGALFGHIPGMEEALADFSTGIFTSELSRQILAGGGELAEIMQRIGRGMTNTDFNPMEYSKTLMRAGELLRKQYGDLAATGQVDFATELFKLGVELAKFNATTTKTTNDWLNSMNSLSDLMTALMKPFKQIVASFLNFDSNEIRVFSESFNSWLSDFSKASNSLAIEINQILKGFGDFNRLDFGERFSLVFERMSDVLAPFLVPVFEDIGNMFVDAMVTALSKIPGVGNVFQGEKEDFYQNLQESREGFMAKNLMESLSNLKGYISDKEDEAKRSGTPYDRARDRTLQKMTEAFRTRLNENDMKQSRMTKSWSKYYTDQLQQFATGGMGNFGSGTPVVLHGTEAVIPTVRNKVPVDVSVKINPVDLFPEGSDNRNDFSLAAKDSTLRELINAVQELIEVNKHHVGATSAQTREIGRRLQNGLNNLEGSFAA